MKISFLLCVLCLSYLATEAIAQKEVPCQVDCKNIPGSTCKDDLCQCLEKTPVLINKTENVKCVKAASLKEDCTYDEQCLFHNNTAVCIENKCECIEGFEEKSGNCVEIEKGGKSDETPTSWRKYVPMIFGIAITFFIIVTLSIYVYRLRKRRKRAKAAAASLEMMTSKNRLSSL